MERLTNMYKMFYKLVPAHLYLRTARKTINHAIKIQGHNLRKKIESFVATAIEEWNNFDPICKQSAKLQTFKKYV